MKNHIYHTLSQTAVKQVEALHASCLEDFPGPALLGLVLPEPDTREDDTFYALYYIEETLVSFLSCFCPDGAAAEISGFTAPAFRNRGFFSCLLKEAKKEAEGLFDEVSFYFQCLAGDPDTAAFCANRGLVFSHAECIMKLPAGRRPCKAEALSPLPPAACRLLPSADWKLLAELHAKSFACPLAFSDDYMHGICSDKNTVSYLISVNERTVGLMHLTFSGNVYLMGLGILPEYRQKGFAGAALQAACALLPEHSGLYLQVSTLNTAAFRLYKKTGFQVSSRLDYFSVRIS